MDINHLNRSVTDLKLYINREKGHWIFSRSGAAKFVVQELAVYIICLHNCSLTLSL